MRLILREILLIFCCIRINSSDEVINCKIPLDLIKGAVPLYMKGRNNTESAFFEPINGTIVIKNDEKVVLACPVPKTESNTVIGQAECGTHNEFHYNGDKVFLQNILCPKSVHPVPFAKISDEKCLKHYSTIDIGFKVNKNFIILIKSCFNNDTQQPIYVQSSLTKSISSIISKRPSWNNRGSFRINLPKDINKLYKSKNQQATINKLLGFPIKDTRYINSNSSQLFFAKGHLSPKSDYNFEAHQRLTFNYYNAAPQWQAYNGGNWRRLEMSIRKFVKNGTVDSIQIYTGIFGTTQFQNVNNELVNIALYVSKDETGNAVVVPEIFWKIIYDPKSLNGTAFVINNSPYKLKTNLCRSVCDQIKWLIPSFQPNNFDIGLTVCCDVNEIRKEIFTMPNLNVKGLLI